MWLTSKAVRGRTLRCSGWCLALWLAACGCTDNSTVSSDTPGVSDALAPPTVELPQARQGDSSLADAQQAADQWQRQLTSVRDGQSDSVQIDVQPIADEQLAELADLTGLQTLILDAGTISDRGLRHIAGLSALEHLRLRLSPITDQGIADAVQAAAGSGFMGSLQVLNLPHSQLTAEGLRQLQAFPRLVQLRIGGRQIDDAAVAEIAKLPNLRSLHLIAPTLTARSLESLAASPKLASFYLDQCPLDDAAWQKLFDAKPKLHVHIDQAHHDLDPNADEHQ